MMLTFKKHPSTPWEEVEKVVRAFGSVRADEQGNVAEMSRKIGVLDVALTNFKYETGLEWRNVRGESPERPSEFSYNPEQAESRRNALLKGLDQKDFEGTILDTKLLKHPVHKEEPVAEEEPAAEDPGDVYP